MFEVTPTPDLTFRTMRELSRRIRQDPQFLARLRQGSNRWPGGVISVEKLPDGRLRLVDVMGFIQYAIPEGGNG